MAVRTTVAAVRKIIEVDDAIIAADADMDPFIEIASAIVDDVCATLTLADNVTLAYDATRLEKIERWLAAHFYAIRDPRVESEGVGPIRTKFQGVTDMHLDHTSYGQMAQLLDTKGGLANLNQATKKGARVKVGMIYVGTPPSESTQVSEFGT